jgi:16S rRNA (adenine1518-N6/adenine1519-N6)-dimethyltransferase
MTSIKKTLDEHGIFPYKGRGQHFLVQGGIVRKIVDVAALEDGDTVVEIGPGTGVLTQALMEQPKRVMVIAIESDKKLAQLITDKFGNAISKGELAKGGLAKGGLDIVFANALKFDFHALGEKVGKKFTVVANLPYNISTEMIFKLLDAGQHIDKFVLMLQKEVAERLTANPGTKKYGALTVMASLLSKISLQFVVGRGNFYPAPNVDSAVVLFEIRPTPLCNVVDLKVFKGIVRASFNNRRKTLRNALKSIPEIVPTDAVEVVGEAAGIDLNRRGETLSVEEFGLLSDAISNLQR